MFFVESLVGVPKILDKVTLLVNPITYQKYSLKT